MKKNSNLYKKSGIVVDDNWFQDVTESAEDTVREFLEVSKEQCKDKNYTENEKQKQEKTTENDIEASNDYDERVVSLDGQFVVYIAVIKFSFKKQFIVRKLSKVY